ncbi:hypothetical protein VE26_04560 [Devosia chinhatensis]|uniref:ROK family transcriptional regulator n=2 Tax=Devosia chinhatensis TaxID=429727 RepID=A0A0F5FM33_9HYPH|nr:hypothetical protein VE26_04560 [Devosia chinhatensis]
MAAALNVGASGAQLARITGLGPQSVSRILAALEASKLIVKGKVLRGQRGKPATPILLNPNGAYAIGCEISWRHYTLVLRNLTGDILGEHRRDYSFPIAEEILDEVSSLIKLLIQIVPPDEKERIVGIGLAMPSSMGRNVDLLGADLAVARGWSEIDVAAAIEKETGLEVQRLNDGSAGCWSELIAYPSPRPQNLAYLFVGTFVGAGLVAEGRLWQGPTGNSANLGSMLVTDEHGQNQFVHLIASLYALENRLSDAEMRLPAGDPMKWRYDTLEPVLSDWIEQSAKALAKVIANSSAVCELSTAIIDSAMPVEITARIVQRTRDRLAMLPVLTFDHPDIVQGKLGARAAAEGAAVKPIYRRLFSRDLDDVMHNF